MTDELIEAQARVAAAVASMSDPMVHTRCTECDMTFLIWEHPTYRLWCPRCKGPSEVTAK